MNDFNTQKLNLNRIRNKNIVKIEDLISEINENSIQIDKEIIELKNVKNKEKRNLLVESKTDDLIYEQYEYYDGQLEKFYDLQEEQLLNKKRQLLKEGKNKLKQEILKQAKMLLVLKDSKDVYTFYKNMLNNPISSEEYAEFERKIYDDFLVAHPSILTIICSYDFMEDIKNKKDDKKEIEEDKKEIEEDKKEIEEVKKEAKEVKEEDKEYEDFLKEFIILLNNVEKEIYDTKDPYDYVNYLNQLKTLVDMCKKLNPEDKMKYIDKVNELVDKHNSKVQDYHKENYDSTQTKKYSLLQIVTEALGKPASMIMGSTFIKKLNKKRLDKINEKISSNDNLSESKLERLNNRLNSTKKKINDNYIINSVKLFRAKNKINDSKEKQYKDSLTFDEREKLFKQVEKFDSVMFAGLYEKSNDEEVLEDEEKIRIILDQYVETLAITNCISDVYEEAIKTLTKYQGSISKGMFEAYRREFNDILNIRENDALRIYELSNDNMDDIIKYYDNEKNLSYHYVRK